MRAKTLVEGSSKTGIDGVLICKQERFCLSQKLSGNLQLAERSLTKMRQVKKVKCQDGPQKRNLLRVISSAVL